MTVKKITSLLFAEEIEPCLNFWVERLRFEKTIDVPEGNKLAFAILQKDGTELMYQTYSSAEKDVSMVSPEVRKGPSFLYVEVENLDQIISAMKGAEVIMPVRTTFYGAQRNRHQRPNGPYHHLRTARRCAPTLKAQPSRVPASTVKNDAH